MYYVFAILVACGIAISMFAEVPSRLDGSAELEVKETQTITMPPAPDAPEKKPAESPPEAESTADLAPESFSTEALVDQGFGASYGSGGGGPAIGGKGGFGSDAGSLVQGAGASDRPARVIARGELEYPSEAKSKGVQGYVVVRLQVGTSGEIENIKIVESNPRGYFDQSVLKFVNSWKFEPGVKSGKVASTWLDQKVRFELD